MREWNDFFLQHFNVAYYGAIVFEWPMIRIYIMDNTRFIDFMTISFEQTLRKVKDYR